MIEIKIILALMFRQYKIEAAYDEFDAQNGTAGVKTTPRGERAYQGLVATAKLAQGMPARARRR